ncbi:MAG: UDP-N-acetylmuramoyl-tripeptide--D-alanyl-D-alanine ligase [Coriobacteriia bacterium]|nr:UDP-N-acetylmuramoyl-tripeptide--D-alanyl-D-alanine ligase [Coriobacteriia bacterium]MCL2746585.1 UDP-N-acetylmuramoyl-tripeptide--D-alanyl-D-alanine ligase [Coriobacteriia bacterium]MCL2870191.1 UDP-N-acetylmuramoyl-tripeptide--D-alanyl-D-alanine ligase [Coriobacteriia bacterium]
MFNFTAECIAKVCSGKIIAGSPKRAAQSCSIDSRQAEQDGLFAAFVGKQSDGHDYIASAVDRGASVILASKVGSDFGSFSDRATSILVDDVLIALQDLAKYQRSLISCPVIGITGSSGKTSTKELLKGALESSLKVIATEGNYNNELGVPLTLLRVRQGTEAVILEMGMRGLGQITELTDIARPTMSIITTIGDAHIEMLGSRENIARAKGEIFEALSEDQLAFMPARVEFGDYLRSVCKASLVTVAIEDSYDAAHMSQSAISAYIKGFDAQGNATVLVVFSMGDELEMKLAIPGEHSVQNALLALAVAKILGIESAVAIKGVEGVQPTDMRMQRAKVNTLIDIQDSDILVDCYNANPESTAASLKTLAVSDLGNPSTGKRIAVLGDMLEMGDHSAKVHKDILLLSGLLNIDVVYTFGQAYTDATQDILRELSTGLNTENIPELRSFTDMKLLIRSLSSELTSGSLILIKGSRSMQMERIREALSVEGDNPC